MAVTLTLRNENWAKSSSFSIDKFKYLINWECVTLYLYEFLLTCVTYEMICVESGSSIFGENVCNWVWKIVGFEFSMWKLSNLSYNFSNFVQLNF